MFKRVIMIVASGWLAWFGSGLAAQESNANLPDDLVSAAIGVRLCRDAECRRANKREEVRPGDQFQIFVSPYELDPGYVYVVYGTTNAALQLNQQHMVVADNELLILPSPEAYQEFSEGMTSSSITVICSAAPLPDFEKLLRENPNSQEIWEQIEVMLRESHILPAGQPHPIISGAVSIAEWDRFEELLMARSDLLASDNNDAGTKPISGAANVRGVVTDLNPESGEIGDFLKNLRFTSGKSLVIKKYAFILQE